MTAKTFDELTDYVGRLHGWSKEFMTTMIIPTIVSCFHFALHKWSKRDFHELIVVVVQLFVRAKWPFKVPNSLL